VLQPFTTRIGLSASRLLMTIGTASPLPPRIGYRGDPGTLSVELIERYALRELSADEIKRAEKHVAKCPVCEERLLR
jgi:hypothetical protein